MICNNCGHEQPVGKFCGSCGQPLTEDAKSVYKGAEANPEFEKVKETSRMYFNYFGDMLKRPSKIFTSYETEVTNGIINIFVGVVLLSLMLAVAAGGDFIGTMLKAVLSIALLYFAPLLATFIALRIGGTAISFMHLVSIYGAHFAVANIISAVLLLLAILESGVGLAATLLTMISIIVMLIIPTYVAASIATRLGSSLDVWLIVLTTLLLAIIFYAVIGRMAFYEAVNVLTHRLNYWLYW